jgi:hypothetical protein
VHSHSLSITVVLLICIGCDKRDPQSIASQTDADILNEESTLLVDDHRVGIENMDRSPLEEDMYLSSELSSNELLNTALKRTNMTCLGPWMCNVFEGCHEGECGQCTDHEECQQGQVCQRREGQTFGECTICSSEDETKHCPEGLMCMDEVCLSELISVVHLEISQDRWQSLSQYRYEDTRSPCQISLATLSSPDEEPQYGDSFPCEIRVHGGSSRDLTKLSWRIILETNHEDLAWGDRHMILRAEYNDLSMMRNVLSLELFRQQTTLPVSRWRYVWLKVNDEDQGLHLQVERMTEPFLERWGRDPTQVRYEADPLSSSTLTGASALVPLNNLQEYWNAYELKGGASYAPLIDFIENILLPISRADWGMQESIRLAQVLKWGEYLRYFAVMTVIQNLDHIRKNYQITRTIDSNGHMKWEVYPWDLDLSWGCLFNDELGTSLCDDLVSDIPLHLGQSPDGSAPSYPTDGLYNLLIERSLTPMVARAKYEAILCELTQPLEENRALSHILRWRNALKKWLEPWLIRDESSRSQDPMVFLAATEALETFLIERSDFIRNQLSCSDE